MVDGATQALARRLRPRKEDAFVRFMGRECTLRDLRAVTTVNVATTERTITAGYRPSLQPLEELLVLQADLVDQFGIDEDALA